MLNMNQSSLYNNTHHSDNVAGNAWGIWKCTDASELITKKNNERLPGDNKKELKPTYIKVV